MKKIPLSGGKAYALVDDEDYDLLSRFNWSVDKYGYAFTMIKMHRFLTRAPREKLVDHKNENRADNQKANLRLCTHKENSWHRRYKKKPHHISKFRGVAAPGRGKGVIAYIKAGGKVLRIGRFYDEHTAALAYDFWASYLHGEYAITNFPIVSSSEKPIGGQNGQMGEPEKPTTT